MDQSNNAIALLFNINSLVQLLEPEINFEKGNFEKDNVKINSITNSDDYHYQSAVGNLIAQISSEEFFKQLRTIEQLGYIVHNCTRSVSSAQYLIFSVQSEKSIDFLEERISKFILFIKDFIRNMESEMFNDFKKSLASTYEKPCLNLSDLGNLCLNQFETGTIDLNFGKEMASIVMSLTKEDLLKSTILDSYIKVFSTKKVKND